MNTDSIVLRAKNEVAEERNKEAIEKLKVLYREEADAQDILNAIKRKIKVEEKKLTPVSDEASGD